MHLKKLCETLLEIDKFYQPIGGIIGYHSNFLRLLDKKQKKDENINFLKPSFIDLKEHNKNVDELINIGLTNLEKFVFICPMGGAGERLELFDPKTNKPMPVAALNFQGKTLLEHFILDIQALEYLYFQTFNKKITLPIVIMTSDEKNNHKHILSIFEEKNYFHRDKNSIRFIKQISSPLITEDGNWALKAPLEIALKPSGHGVLWHLMEKENVFDFLKKHKKEKAIIRQINNPIAGLDYLQLSFMGAAIKYNKSFGFVSCEKNSVYKEGLNVLKEKIVKDGYLYNISNIEYTDFEKYNLQNIDANLANTNILFADLKEVRKAALIDPFPALTINLKTKVFSQNREGKIVETKAGRLESMMQNISDSIQDFRAQKTQKDDLNLKTFITLSKRGKTISTTKNAFKEGCSFFETPQKCFYDVLSNYRDLLKNYCNIKMSDMPTIEEFILNGPSFICYLHPMLGPLYSQIAKKIQKGQIIKGSEMHLEIAELSIENLYLNGSLLIATDLSNNNYNKARCVLENVKVKNLGIDKTKNKSYWQNNIQRKEYLKIILNQNSQFYAKNIEFLNTQEIIVPSFHKMFIVQENSKITYKVEQL